MDLTEKRSRSKVAALMKRALDFYDKSFPASKPSDSFWIEVDRLDDELGEALAKRPLGAMQIDDAIRVFGLGFKRAVRREQQAGGAATKGGA